MTSRPRSATKIYPRHHFIFTYNHHHHQYPIFCSHPSQPETMIDQGTQLPQNRIRILDPIRLLSDSDYHSYGSFATAATNHCTAGYCKTFTDRVSSSNSEGLRFAAFEGKEEDGSNVSSPQLWNNTPASTPKAAGSPIHYQALSPNSRTRAIARGQRELMEMIRDMPESFYELSLKDIVEQKAAIDQAVLSENRVDEEKVFAGKADGDLKEKRRSGSSKKVMRKVEGKPKMVRGGSINSTGGGMLLRITVFPAIFGAKRSKISLGSGAVCKMLSKASSSSSAVSGSGNGAENEWWKRRACIPREKENGELGAGSGSTSSSGSDSRGRYNSKLLSTCCYFSSGNRIPTKP